jgi:hypothetical protein
MKEVTKTFTVTASSDEVMKRFERFLALLHFNSGFGHSGTFGMPLDGDGSEKISVDELKAKYHKGSLPHEVELIAGAGYSVELAHTNGYGGFYRDRSRECRYRVGPAANLYKNGEVIRTSPSKDWDYEPKDKVPEVPANIDPNRPETESQQDFSAELSDRPGGCRKA